MSQINDFDGLPEFLAISKRLSIRKAAIDLGKTPGSVSQALQKLEHRLGMLLFHRTTRKMALTEAGQNLLLKIEPAARAIAVSLEDAAQSSNAPAGTLRLIVERLALPHVIEPLLPAFRQEWPNVNLDITVSNRHNNFISEGYDAGILIGSYIEQDMIAVRLSKPFQWAVFGLLPILGSMENLKLPTTLLIMNASDSDARKKAIFIVGNLLKIMKQFVLIR
ncbi:LysR substrate binding domain-containing protein [Erwinia sp. AG740]|nr:LysR substrate binding domain-containing protein [Erwinia sp. AG740]